MALPKQVILIPLMKEMSDLGLIHSVWGSMFAVICPVVGWPFGVFMMKQFSENIPVSLLEAARIDGAGELTTFINVAFPIIRPGFGALAIFTFINSWNEYVWPVLILKSKENYTLSLALQMYISAEGGTEFTIAMAVSVITMIIPLALYLIFQRYIINTFAMSGIKG